VIENQKIYNDNIIKRTVRQNMNKNKIK